LSPKFTKAKKFWRRLSKTDVLDGNRPDIDANGAGYVYWPLDLLPTDCPEARITTWGYDTVVTKGIASPTNKNNIFAHARDLLYSLHRERPLNRQLIFVAHSLGGIVVKEVNLSFLGLTAVPGTILDVFICNMPARLLTIF
jgi:hypothetical protein